MKKNVAIEVKNLKKYFKLPTERSDSLKQVVVNWFKGIKGYKKQQVLKDISFEVNKGDFIGIVGRNGSGKSTLLKLISGIYTPNGGKININGSLVSFIELGVGFNPELTGRENIFLNGALMGFTTKEVASMYDEIVEFAELEDFMDQKLKNYSSGMQVRLAFSCAIRAHSDILVLDEILAVGDEAFQHKCNDFFDNIKKDKSKTVVLVTHSMASVRKYCNRAILIRDGLIEIDGSPEDVANAYSLENVESMQNSQNDKDEKTEKSPKVTNCKIKLLSPKKSDQNQPIEVEVSYTKKEDIDTCVAVTLWDIRRSQPLVNSNTQQDIDKTKGHKKVKFKFDVSALNDADIRINASIRDGSMQILNYMSDAESPTLIFRRNDYPNMNKKTTNAILFDRGKFERE